MKKILLSVILILSICSVPVMSNEVEDDYFDIAANYCVFGNYNSAMEYLDKILTINPNNQRAMDLKKGLTHVISGDKSSFVEGVNPLIKQAMEYKRTGDEQAELRTLVQATQGNNSYLAYYYLGNLYRLKKDYQHALDARLLDPVKGQILLRKVVLGNDAQKILARQVFQIVLIIGKNRKVFLRSDRRRIGAKLLLVRDRKFQIEFIANPYVRSRIMIMNIFKRR